MKWWKVAVTLLAVVAVFIVGFATGGAFTMYAISELLNLAEATNGTQ